MFASLLTRAESAKQRFSEDKNVERTMAELRGVFETFFVRASYLIGHIDGMESTLEREAPALARAISKTTRLRTLWTRYWELLRTLFEKIEEWEGVSEYQPLKALGEELLLRGGMVVCEASNRRVLRRLQSL
jgi:hypothetical protein